MTSQEFLAEASNLLTDNPMDRLSAETKKMVEHDNYIADIHCHFFDVKTINIRYFLLRSIKDKLGLRDDEIIIDTDDPKVKYLKTSYESIYENELLRKKVDTDEDWADLLTELEYVDKNKLPVTQGEKDVQRGIFDVLANRGLLRCKNMEDVYKYYLERFTLNQYKEFGLDKKDLIVTALMMDLETGWDVTVRKNMRDQISELKALASDHPVLPFLPTDPRRTEVDGDFNIYRLFLEAFNKEGGSFFGVKIYPGLGYLPSDYRLWPIFEICEKKNIPVLTHCGGEAVTTDELELEAYRMEEKVIVEADKRQEVAEQLNHPKEWIPVMEKFPGLRINFGHFGGNTAWEEYDKNGGSEKVKTILDMMAKYDHVYADFSWNMIDSSLYSIYKTVIGLSDKALDRSLYGTDYWVVCPAGNLQRRQAQFLEILKDHIPKLTYENVKSYLF